MADFKIKPAAGTGNKLILESEDGTDVLTTSDSGVAITAPTIADLSNVTGTLPVGVTGGSGLAAIPTSQFHGDFVYQEQGDSNLKFMAGSATVPANTTWYFKVRPSNNDDIAADEGLSLPTNGCRMTPSYQNQGNTE